MQSSFAYKEIMSPVDAWKDALQTMPQPWHDGECRLRAATDQHPVRLQMPGLQWIAYQTALH